VAYFGFMVWTVLFLVFPPLAYVDTLDLATRIFWMGVCFVGATGALSGALLRLDIKLELPGLILLAIGPLFYCAAQVYYLVHPPVHMDPSARIALAVYALLPLLLIVPRMYGLYHESRRLKRLNSRDIQLTPEQEAQPGAFKITLKRGQ
jgi:hypothetical protein